MAEGPSISFEPGFLDRGRLVTFVQRCDYFARRLNQALGGGVSLHFIEAMMLSPMASFRYRGANVGQIAWENGHMMIPGTLHGGWGDDRKAVSDLTVWSLLFRPYLLEYVMQEQRRIDALAKLARRTQLITDVTA